MVEAETTEKTMKRRLEERSTEIEGIKNDLESLEKAKAELDASQNRNARHGGQEGALVLEGSRLEEYHRIKEDNTDKNKVETLSRERQENIKMIEMLTDDLQQATDRISSMQRVIAETEHDIAFGMDRSAVHSKGHAAARSIPG